MFLWIILIVAVMTFITMLTFLNKSYGFKGEHIPLSVIISVASVVISFFLFFTAGALFEYEIYEKEKIDIYAIKDNTEINGQFALGFGNVNEESYFYYIEEDNGFKLVKKIPTAESKLKEENVDQPHIIKYGSRYKSNFAKWLFGEEFTLLFEGYKYELHVPKDTVTTEFDVNLE
ncbi:MAG: hypothetical protein ACI35O_10260 [Bacillaceae bacterium]